jgi:hypothetical protein
MGKKPSVMEALKAVGKGDPRQTSLLAAAASAPSSDRSVAEPDAQEKPERRRARPHQPQTGSSNPSRVGRVNVTGYFDPAVKQSLRLIQAKFPDRRTEQELLAEALDDLFAKYGVPQTARTVHF